MGMQAGGGGRFLSEVNVTPFVDVMLVLLIIFMVTAPMMTQGLEVDLPQTRAVSVQPQNNRSIAMTVKSDG
jgi:biopolymer transport protein TolR